MDRSLFDFVTEVASVAVAGRSARPSRPYPRSADRAPVVRLESVPTVARPPRDYSLPAGRVRVVVAVRKGGPGK